MVIIMKKVVMIIVMLKDNVKEDMCDHIRRCHIMMKIDIMVK